MATFVSPAALLDASGRTRQEKSVPRPAATAVLHLAGSVPGQIYAGEICHTITATS